MSRSSCVGAAAVLPLLIAGLLLAFYFPSPPIPPKHPLLTTFVDTTSPSKLASSPTLAPSTTLATHPHIRPPLPLSPPLSTTDLRTIEGATAKMFGHFVGMMRGAWVEGCLREACVEGCLRDYDGQVVGKGGEGEDLEKESEGEKRLREIEARVWREFEAKGCHYGVREWVLEV